MPASMHPVVSASQTPVPADAGQANPSATGTANGKPFADALTQQMQKHNPAQGDLAQSQARSRAAQQGETDTKGQTLASPAAEDGKQLPPNATRTAAQNCACPSGSDGKTGADEYGVKLDQILGRNSSGDADLPPGLERALEVGQTPKFETALENVSKHDSRSALLDLILHSKTQETTEVVGENAIEVVEKSAIEVVEENTIGKGMGQTDAVSSTDKANLAQQLGQPAHNLFQRILGQQQHQDDAAEALMDDSELTTLPVNVMNLPQGLDWLNDLDINAEQKTLLTSVYMQLQSTGQGGAAANATGLAGMQPDALRALQRELGTSFELAGDYKGSVKVLTAQREAVNMQNMFGGGMGKDNDGVGGLFKLIALQKVATAVNHAQMGSDKMQFQQLLQTQLMTSNNQGLFKALGDDSGQAIPLLQASGALLSTQSGAQGQQTQLSNFLMSSSTINQPIGQEGWDRAVGERLQWMVKQDMQQAELKLNPKHLGPIEVKITMGGQDQTTTVHFTAAHSVTRDALEAAIPRLREMLGEQGMNMVDVNVSQHSNQQKQQAGDDAHPGQGREHAADAAITNADEQSLLDAEESWQEMPGYRQGRRILDAFV